MPIAVDEANAADRAANTPPRRLIAFWLLVCCGLLFALIVVGGVTRLTHSGLSIVEWQPLVGTVPPLDTEQWEEVFTKYQRTPEYQQINHHMTLSEFKGIFWWEYGHRLLGRGIGVVFLLPLIYFLARRRIDRALGLKLGGIFLLGGLQGAMGWYMVKSGLINEPHVSQFRLTAHLGIALLIYAAMFWVALDLLRSRAGHATAEVPQGLRRGALALAALVLFVILTGGFVAGIRAGLAYNTFPLMNGYLIPPEILMLDPWYANFFSNMATVQFDHRLIALLLALLVLTFWWKSMRHELAHSARWARHALLAALAIQIALGIGTLLLVVPVWLAALHQAGAVLLFTAALWVAHEFSAAGGSLKE